MNLRGRNLLHALIITNLAWSVYVLVFIYAYDFLGLIASAFVVIPIATGSFFGGLGSALLSACISFSFNMFLFIRVGEAPMEPIEHVPGNIVVFLFALAIGWVNEIRFRLGREVAIRQLAQAELRLLNADLDGEVQKRSEELMASNRKLREELEARIQAQEEVSYREEILSAVAHIGEASLKARGWVRVVEEVLADIGQAANVDRAYIFKNREGPQGELLTSYIFEWVSEGFESRIDDERLQDVDVQVAGFGRWVEELSQGRAISGPVSELPRPERSILEQLGSKSTLAMPIFTGKVWWGLMGLDSVRRTRSWNKAEIEALKSAANILGGAIQRENDYEKTLLGWAKALELRDQLTSGHTERVTDLAILLARAVAYPAHEMKNLRWGALLHDIGKVGIPDAILNKPGPLSKEEWAEMRKHPQYAQELLAPISFLEPALSIPLYHHERWDGSGYPFGLQGEDIPLAARIFAVVDVWDALNSDRPYRKRWPTEEITAHLQDNRRTLFQPEIIDTFIELLEEEAIPSPR